MDGLGKFNATLTDYLREVFCVCPKCGSIAIIRAESKYAIPWCPYNVSFTCLSCPNREQWPSSSWASDFSDFNPAYGIEPYFGYQLALQANVKGGVLAVLNPSHARDIAEFVAEKNRLAPANSKWAMVNRLPKWVKLARNRDHVIRALENLQRQASGLA